MKHQYRMLDESGNVTWQGSAFDVAHAEERCFYDETPGSLERFTLQVWGKVRLTRQISSHGWKTIYSNECLASL